MQKILFIIIDGLGDKAIPQLGDRTPLEAAKTPNLDWLTTNGISGLVIPFCEKGKLPTSEDTHLALFGYNPKVFNPGRGVFEALGLGMKIYKGDVCLRGNFATLDKNLKIIDRRAGRIEKTEDLVKAISGIKIEGIRFLLKKSVSHRIAILMRGKGLSSEVSDGDPKETGNRPLRILAKEKTKKAIFTAKVLNEFLEKSYFILERHSSNKKRKKPANFILVRGAGSFKEIPAFRKKYKMRACCVAGGALYKGIGKFLGMDIIRVKGANALPTTNLKGKIQAVKTALKKLAPYRPAESGTGAGYDFVFCHIKAADNLAEDGDFKGKKKFLEKIDQNLTSFLKLKDTLIVITGDHSTCSFLKKHCLEPFPILVYGRKIDEGRGVGNKIQHFSERACKGGKLGKINQLDLLPVILKIAQQFTR